MVQHPGQILHEKFMIPLGLTAGRMAKGLGVNRSTLGRLLSGEQRLSIEMAARLGAYFNVPARWWLQMQAEFDAQEIEEHPKWCRGIFPLHVAPNLLLTPKGVLDLDEPAEGKTTASQPRGVRVVHYENGAVALVGDAP